VLLIERFSELGGRHTASDKNIQRRKMQKTGEEQANSSSSGSVRNGTG